MTREDLADVLENIALLLELKGENPFKIRAYRTGAETVMQYPGDIVEKARLGELEGIKGIGDALQQKLHELASTGKLGFWEKLRGEFPETIFELFDVQGLGPKKVKALYEELGIASIAALKKACEEGRVAGLTGFGQKSAEKIREAIAFLETNADRFRLGDVAAAVEMILDSLKSHPACLRAEVGGSFRRGKETVHDLDFLVATGDPQAVMDHFVGQAWVKDTIAHGRTKSSIRLENGLQCDLRAVANDEWACALMYFTGSKEHNVAIRGRANDRGYTLNEYRLAPREGSEAKMPPVFGEERDLYAFLGLDYIAPELRENGGEIEAAAAHTLPRLIELENLRGTFHNHTTASDGRNTVPEMADAARELGLQYLGIADHSKSSFQANGLDETRLRAQIAEIRDLNRRYADEGETFRLFAGSEVDIHKDGSLDYDEELLAELDYVVASVHNAMTLPEAEMTARLIRAAESPHVTMLGHLTGRLLLQREPYAVDIPAVIEACADTGTWIELNCNPWRLDLDWRWWRLATEKGVKCVINPDGHRVADLHYLWFGIKQARKGWLTRADVMNCLPLDAIEEALGAKRKRG
ncbi:MAG: DNA polymerase/3'-5' exonuclease PolX [Verrucomicrobiales bacterium]|nr:DNA polymerase/3'-5' exonuclease PolX [Verrucomicrobiales bacterium]